MRLVATLKLFFVAVIWIALSPILALPYFAAVTKLVEHVPGSSTQYETTWQWLQNSLVMGYYSIVLLVVTAPLVGIGTHFLNRWSQQHFGRKARWLLCATLVGWFHCASYLVLANVMVEYFV